MSPFVWGLSSFGLSAALIIPGGGVVIVLLAQVGLFAVLTWYNGYRKRKKSS